MMARKARIHYPGAIYHVLTRGNNSSAIFNSAEDKNRYLSIVLRYKAKYDFELYAYCITDNLAHLIIKVNEIPLSKIMQGIQLVYTQKYNLLYNCTGHVFDQRYKASICDDKINLIKLIKYVHQLPAQFRGSGNFDYPWSSHKEFKWKSDIADTEYPLALFSPYKSIAINNYLTFMRYSEAREQRFFNALRNGTNIDLRMDTEDNTSALIDGDTFFDKLLKAIEKQTGFTIESIYGNSKAPMITALRKVIVLLMVKYSNCSNTEIANKLGIQLSTVSNIISGRFQKTQQFKGLFNAIESSIE